MPIAVTVGVVGSQYSGGEEEREEDRAAAMALRLMRVCSWLMSS